MARPLDIQEQKQFDWFKPRYKILITFGMSKFDECYKIAAKKGQKDKFV